MIVFDHVPPSSNRILRRIAYCDACAKRSPDAATPFGYKLLTFLHLQGILSTSSHSYQTWQGGCSFCPNYKTLRFLSFEYWFCNAYHESRNAMMPVTAGAPVVVLLALLALASTPAVWATPVCYATGFREECGT